MDRNNSDDSLQNKIGNFPRITFDKDLDFLSIRMKNEIEAKSYYGENGLIFSEDKYGNVIEVQILNLTEYLKKLEQSKDAS